MKYYPSSSWIWLTHNLIASIISLISSDIHTAEPCQLRRVRSWSAASADNFLTPSQYSVGFLLSPLLSGVGGALDSSGNKCVVVCAWPELHAG